MPPVPAATYRIQLTPQFGFRECAAIVPYLRSLGISTLYCSPVLQAVPGSSHGYDVVDPTRVSEDLGGMEGWRTLVDAVGRNGLMLLLDIVPNHMAATPLNPWWWDVLEYGRLSRHAALFDIDWAPPLRLLHGRLMLPVLPQPLRRVVAQGRLRVGASADGLVLRFGSLAWPLALRSYRGLLQWLHGADAGLSRPEATVALRAIATLDGVLRHGEPAGQWYERLRDAKRQIMALLQDGPAGPEDGALAALLAGDDVLPPSAVLRRLLREQHYALAFWQTGRHHINYRRFFDISDLVGVRVESRPVFERTHAYLRQLAGSPVVCGFRVDHVDGLQQPLSYLTQLRTVRVATENGGPGRVPYVVVEKILSAEEELPAAWPVAGTTGYDFLNEATGLFIDATGLDALGRHHRRVTGVRQTRAQLTQRNKRHVLHQLFRADLAALASCLRPLAAWLHPCAGISSVALTHALAAVTAALPAYRTYYPGAGELAPVDRRRIEAALAHVQPGDGIEAQALEVVRRALLLDVPAAAPGAVRQAARTHLLRWQQLSGAAMAKGFEDTTLYQESTCLALNAVGSRDTLAATTLEHFHLWNARRLRHWPDSMNGTATHDAKRGEDVRARIAVLSEMPHEWSRAVDRWLVLTRQDPVAGPLARSVDAATLMFLLQTVVGAWPEPEEMGGYAARLVEYMVKAAREAKWRSSWLEPDRRYEGAIAALIEHMVVGRGVDLFQECFGRTIAAVCFHGLVNSVTQVLLKVASPGVPDCYQGTELLDLTLVDPDNRRPVDFASREALLRDWSALRGTQRASSLSSLLTGWPDARAKLHVLAAALRVRRAHPGLFRRGSYLPLHSTGARGLRVCAFGRSYRGRIAVVVTPLCSSLIAGRMSLPLGTRAWGEDSLILPQGSAMTFHNALTGERVAAQAGRLRIADVLATFPVALLLGSAPRV